MALSFFFSCSVRQEFSPLRMSFKSFWAEAAPIVRIAISAVQMVMRSMAEHLGAIEYRFELSGLIATRSPPLRYRRLTSADLRGGREAPG